MVIKKYGSEVVSNSKSYLYVIKYGRENTCMCITHLEDCIITKKTMTTIILVYFQRLVINFISIGTLLHRATKSKLNELVGEMDLLPSPFPTRVK